MAIAVTNTGYIWTSSDKGATWTEQTSSGNRKWLGLAGTTDLTELVAVAYGGGIFTSTDFGLNWVERTAAGVRQWQGVCSSVCSPMESGRVGV